MTHTLTHSPHVLERAAVEWEALVIREVPVEDVELVHLHEIQDVRDGSHADEMTSGVEHESAVAEAGKVADQRGIDAVLRFEVYFIDNYIGMHACRFVVFIRSMWIRMLGLAHRVELQICQQCVFLRFRLACEV